MEIKTNQQPGEPGNNPAHQDDFLKHVDLETDADEDRDIDIDNNHSEELPDGDDVDLERAE